MAIDLGNDPGGTPPTTAEKLQIRSAIGVGTADAPTFLAQTLTGQSLTGTQATSLVDLAATWNTTGNPSLIYGRVTNTNSGASANLIDLGTFAGGSLFKVDKAGSVIVGAGGIKDYGSGQLGMGGAGASSVYVSLAYFQTTGANGFALGPFGSPNTFLTQDAAGILAQRNGTTAQAFRVYNTYPGTTANEWGEIDWKTTANVLRIGTAHSGTGGSRALEFATSNTGRWQVSGGSGHFLASTDNTYDIGASGGNRPRDLYIGRDFYLGSDRSISFGTRSAITSAANGQMRLSNNAGNDFSILQLGGTTSAFPAIKRNGTGIDIRLADDSGYANLTAGVINSSGVSAIQAGGNLILGTGGSGRALIFGGGTKSTIGGDTDGVLIMTNNAGTSFTRLEFGTANLGISRGTGSPEGIVTALVGSLYIRTDGGASTTLYVKESSPTPSTGWVAK